MTRDQATLIATDFRNGLRLGGGELPASFVSVHVTADLDEKGALASDRHIIAIALNPEIETHVDVPASSGGLEVRRVDWVSGATQVLPFKHGEGRMGPLAAMNREIIKGI